MITVKIVYVDPTGEVRMSPTGWPEKPTEGQNWPYLKGVKYETLLQKAKKESIPFENKEAIADLVIRQIRRSLAKVKQVSEAYLASYGVDRDHFKPGKLYTIEPIQVVLQHQYFSIFDDKWYDVSDGNFSHKRKLGANESTLRIVARIVTEEEKPAPTIHRNPRVFLREDELYAFVEEVPTAPKYSDYVQHDRYYWQVKKYDHKKRDFDAAIERAKSSAIKVKNQDEIRETAKFNNWIAINPPFYLYTLEGYQMEVVDGFAIISTVLPLNTNPTFNAVDSATLGASVVERKQKPAPWSSITPERWAEFGQHYKGEPRQPASGKIKVGDTFYVEGHERSHTCVGYEGEEDIVAENNLPYKRSKCSLLPPAPVVDKPAAQQVVNYQLCPKCHGQGIFSKPPYVAGDVHEWSSTSAVFTCDVCNGAKIILPFIITPK